MATKKNISVTIVTNEKEKAQSLKAALGQIEKKFGAGAIMRMGDKPMNHPEIIPTGAINLNAALGIGGIPKGRITEVYGPEASGKTTLTLHLVAECQKLGGTVAFIDAEHALDPIYSQRIGVDVGQLLLSQPDGGEQALEIVETLVRSSAVDLIVVDSVAALVPTAEIKGEMGDSHVGLQARLMSQALRKLTSIINRSNTAVIFINQTRMKIGASAGYGSPETTTGGVALKFYSSIRLEVRSYGSIKESSANDAEKIGTICKVKVVKNKFAPPFKKVEFPIMFGLGISHFDIILEIGTENDIIKKSGSWYSYGSTRLGQGSEKVKTFFKENPIIFKEIEDKVKLILNPPEEEENTDNAKSTSKTDKKEKTKKAVKEEKENEGNSKA